MKTLGKLTPLAAAVLALSTPAFAGEAIEFGDGWRFDWTVNTTYTLSVRMKDQDAAIARNAGANDGDNNFNKGSLTANRLGLLFDTKLTKGQSGFVLSGSTFYDDVYHRSNDNNPSPSNPNGVNKPPPFNEFTGGARRYHGGYSRVLDAYGFSTFDLGGSRSATVRLGRHVVSWGEALFFPSISLAQGPADGTKTGIPGTETKDQLLPEDQISATIVMSDKWSLLGHLQFGFHETLAPAPGSYLNSSDGVGPGGTCLGPYSTIPSVPALGFRGFAGCSFGNRRDDIRPREFGQFGLGTRYRVTDATELGLYYLNYKDRTPIPEINAFTPGVATPAALRVPGNQIGNGSYRIRYFDDVKLLGGTFSTTLGSIVLAGEISHKWGAPVLVNTVVNPATKAVIANPTRGDLTQVNVNAFANVGRTPLADSLTVLGEIAYVHTSNVDARKAPGVEALGAAAAAFPSTNQLTFGSKDAVAATGQIVLSYPGIFEGWDLSVPISYSRQLSGRTITGGVGGQGDSRYSLGATFTRRGNLAINLTYLGFLGKAQVLPTYDQRLLTDRDQLSLVLKYSF